MQEEELAKQGAVHRGSRRGGSGKGTRSLGGISRGKLLVSPPRRLAIRGNADGIRFFLFRQRWAFYHQVSPREWPLLIVLAQVTGHPLLLAPLAPLSSVLNSLGHFDSLGSNSPMAAHRFLLERKLCRGHMANQFDGCLHATWSEKSKGCRRCHLLETNMSGLYFAALTTLNDELVSEGFTV